MPATYIMGGVSDLLDLLCAHASEPCVLMFASSNFQQYFHFDLASVPFWTYIVIKIKSQILVGIKIESLSQVEMTATDIIGWGLRFVNLWCGQASEPCVFLFASSKFSTFFWPCFSSFWTSKAASKLKACRTVSVSKWKV
jgi:hypothetical protein